MIVEFFLEVIFQVVYLIVEALPNALFNIPNWGVQTLKLVRIGLGLFPSDVWLLCVGSGILWFWAHLNWKTLEWIYKKIPGVN